MLVKKSKVFYNFIKYAIEFECYNYITTTNTIRININNKTKQNKIYFYVNRIKLILLIKITLDDVLEIEQDLTNSIIKLDILECSIPKVFLKLEELIKNYDTTNNNEIYKVLGFLYMIKDLILKNNSFKISLKDSLIKLIDKNCKFAKIFYFLFFQVRYIKRWDTDVYKSDLNNMYDTGEDMILYFIN
jgi:hypothetical protein